MSMASPVSDVADVADPGGETSVSAQSPRLLRRLLRRPVAVGCVTFLALLAGIAIVAPIMLPNVSSEQAGDLLTARQLPTGGHWLGTDTLGRDVFARLMVGTRITLVGVVEALAVVLAIGLPLGLAAGYFGGRLDRFVSWLADLAFSMPAIVIVLVVLSVFPQNMTAAMITFALIAAPGLTRIVRSATLPVREELYIAAAEVSGLSRPYIVARHILPRISGVVIVQASLLAGVALLVQTGLGFLSLVVPAPAPSWGGMIADGAKAIVLQPWLIWPPGLAVALTILVLGLLGDAVRDATTEGWAPPVRSGRRRPLVTSVESDRRGLSPECGSGRSQTALLSIEGLHVGFTSGASTRRVLEDVTLSINEGEAVGLVGESGCGKTTVAMAVLGLLTGSGQIEGGRIQFDGRDLGDLVERELREVRGRQIGLVSQEPIVGLTPVFRVGWLLAEAVRTHHDVSRREARARAVELLRQVHFADPEAAARRYPHELSGGMAQRVAIARALAGEPKLLIADEPTTALDVTVQAEILDLLRELQVKRNMALLLITHDWGVVADICDRAIVMYAGQIVEQAEVRSILQRPLHPYTEALLSASPNHASATECLSVIPGDVPRPGLWPTGCHFHPRCGYATSLCRAKAIPLELVKFDRQTRCIHHDKMAGSAPGTVTISKNGL